MKQSYRMRLGEVSTYVKNQDVGDTVCKEVEAHSWSVAQIGDEEVTLLDLLVIVVKRKKMILKVTSAAALVALLVSYAIPNMYTAVARILPPQQTQSSAVAMLAQLNPLASGLGKDLGLKNPGELYVTMLRSRSVEDNLINRFDLRKVYGYKTYLDARSKLEGRAAIIAGKDGVIAISVEDRDPRRAADLANAYVDELTKLTQRMAITEAAQRRLFFEKQLLAAKQDLAQAEIGLRETQETTGLIELDGQSKAIITSATMLKAQIAAKEVMLQRAHLFATEKNPEYQGLQQELNSLKNQLERIEQTQSGGKGEVQIATSKIPAAGLEYVRRYRDVKYYEAIFEVLAKQYEAAKLDEAKNAALIQVMDQAIEPERKSSPKRGLIVCVTGVLAFFIAVISVLIKESYEHLRKNSAIDERLRVIGSYLWFGSTDLTTGDSTVGK